MVTKKGTAEFLPEQWKDAMRRYTAKFVTAVHEPEAYNELESLVDRCVTEAIIGFIAELPDPEQIVRGVHDKLADELGHPRIGDQQ